MLFNSLHFLLFFPAVSALYFILPHRVRAALLLFASCYFYMVFKPIYILILVFTITVDYFAGRLIANSIGARRKGLLLGSIVANVGVLSIFKYFNFANSTLASLFHTVGWAYSVPALRLLLPIGLSFHVFQSLSYTIEVYRGRQEPERNFLIFALYVMFYPQLVAGPIERPQHLLPQFRETHQFEYGRVVRGLQMMTVGMFKKVVIADRLAPFVNSVYDHPRQFPGISLIIATVFFALQIYCDFAGYSDIALGSAEVMGFKLMANFDRPYFATSIGQFWKRWHISLSSWFRDYVYIPLGGNRVRTWRRYVNIMITFLLSGLWHGASWTFVFWGALNGAYLIGEQVAGSLGRRWFLGRTASVLGGIRTFTLTCIAWVFFRATSLSDGLYIVRHLLSGLSGLPHLLLNGAFQKRFILLMQGQEEFWLALISIAVLICMEALAGREDLFDQLKVQNKALRWAVYYAGIASIIFFGAFNSSQQFIYFQF